MAQFGYSIQTAQVTTGNFRTTIDQYDPTLSSPYNLHGARNPLGAAYVDNPGSLTNPNGVATKYRYVRYNSTSNPALTAVTGPFIVYWTDATFTTVTPVETESLGPGINFIAGLAMPNVTALSSLTAAQLNGNYCWIAVGGYVPGAYSLTTALAIGDSVYGSATAFTPGHVATGVATLQRVLGYAITATSSSLYNALLTLES